MQTKIRLISDGILLTYAAIYFIIVCFCCLFTIWLVEQPGVVADPNEIGLIQIIFAVMIIALLSSLILALSRSVCYLTLTDNAITIRTAFRKKILSYKNFPYIYVGYYFHGNIFGCGASIYYLVFSSQRLSNDTLTNINRIKCSDQTIKIRYTKTNYKKLCTIAPVDAKQKMDSELLKFKLL